MNKKAVVEDYLKKSMEEVDEESEKYEKELKKEK